MILAALQTLIAIHQSETNGYGNILLISRRVRNRG